MSDKISNIQQLAYFDIAVHKDQAWFFNYWYGAICRISLDSQEIDLESFIPDHGTNTVDLYGPIAYYKGNLLLAPRCSDRILLYNLSEKTFQEIALSMDTIEKQEQYKLFMNIVILDNTAYLLPCRYPAVVKINMDTLELTYYDSWYPKLKGSLRERHKFIFGKAAVRNKNECIFPVWQNSLLMEFNLETGEYAIHQICDEFTSFSAVAFDGEDYWIAPQNKNMLLKWKQKKNITVYDDFPADFRMEGDIRFISVECIGEEIIAVPKYGSGNMIVALDRRTGKFRKVRSIMTSPIDRLKEGPLGHGLLLCSKKVSENRLVVFSDFDGKTLVISQESGKSTEFETVLKKEKQILYAQQILFDTSERILTENQDVILTDYIQYIKLCEQKNKGMNTHKTAGGEIYKEITGYISV